MRIRPAPSIRAHAPRRGAPPSRGRLLTAALTAAATAVATAVTGVTLAPAAVAAPATAVFTETSDWGSGFEGRYVVTNGTTSTINGWAVQIDLPAGANVTSAWDATLSRNGQRFTFTALAWNRSIPPGGTAAFGFVATPGGATAPSNCLLNGAPCSGGGTPGVPAAPGTPTVTGRTNSSIALAWSGSGGATGYRVYEGSAVRATVTGTSATIGSLGTCTTHTYTVRAYNAQGESPASGSVTATTTGCTNPPPPPPGGDGEPYLYVGWGDPPDVRTVMTATGIRHFTMAFILSGGGCAPAWDSSRPLRGGVDEATIAQIRAAGGDITPSIGGWSGNKLGPNCSSAAALAGAYQQVIDAYGLRSIDIDIENSDEFESEVVQDRVLGALKIVEQNNPGITTVLTFGTGLNGPNYWGTRLINRARELAVPIDVWTIMPFNFGGHANMYNATVSASEGLKSTLRSAYGWTDAQAYARMGISGMNGLSDQQEQTSLAQWTQIRDWAKARGLARLAFWSVNRDRPCPGGGVSNACSGIAQNPWDFTRVTAGF